MYRKCQKAADGRLKMGVSDSLCGLELAKPIERANGPHIPHEQAANGAGQKAIDKSHKIVYRFLPRTYLM